MRTKIGYTEFSYGYGFTENLIRSSTNSVTGAPYFPNLVQEAKLGYDVRIDLPACPLFFQFKLPEVMVRDTAFEISKHQLPGISCNFFRMPLMRRDLSDQHIHLIQLEQSNLGLVYYASPMMEDIGEFNDAYNNCQIHHRTAFLSPTGIGPLPDDKKHTVSYMANATFGWLCSEPREVRVSVFDKLMHQIGSAFDDPKFSQLEEVAFRLRGTLREVAGGAIAVDEAALRQRLEARIDSATDGRAMAQRTRETVVELLASREIARIGLGLEMIIVQPMP